MRTGMLCFGCSTYQAPQGTLKRPCRSSASRLSSMPLSHDDSSVPPTDSYSAGFFDNDRVRSFVLFAQRGYDTPTAAFVS